MFVRTRSVALWLAASACLMLTIAPAEASAQEPFLGEIRMFAGGFAPRGWAFCDGRMLPIGQHQALFSILGTTFGGDGRTTFALPDLRGRAPVHVGQRPGAPEVRWGQEGEGARVARSADAGAPSTLPYLGIQYIIAMEGTYPSRN